MPDEPADDLAPRVTRLEHDVADLCEVLALSRTDASAARMPASGADHDVSEVRAELRAHTRALNALRETQVETIAEMRQGLNGLEQSLRAEMQEGFATVHTGVARIVDLLGGPDR